MSVCSAGKGSSYPFVEYEDNEGSNNKPSFYSGGGSSDSQSDGSSSVYTIRGRRLSSAYSASAYLVPAFNSCANSSNPTDLDASLLRYTRPNLFCNSSEETSLLQQFLNLRTSSDSSPSPARSPAVFCTPAKGAVLEDGVLVINDEPKGDSRSYYPSARRILSLGAPCSANSTTNGARFFNRRAHGRRSFDDAGYAMDYQMMAWLANGSQMKQHSRQRRLPSPSPATQRISYWEEEKTPPPVPSRFTAGLGWAQTAEEQEAELGRTVQGPRRWRRLPVFALICPED